MSSDSHAGGGHHKYVLMVINIGVGLHEVDIRNHALEALLWSHGMYGVFHYDSTVQHSKGHQEIAQYRSS